MIAINLTAKIPTKCREAFYKRLEKCNKELQKEAEKEAKKEAKKAAKKEAKKAAKEAEKAAKKEEPKKVTEETQEKAIGFIKCREAFYKRLEKCNKELQKEAEKEAKKAAKKEAKKAAKEAEKAAKKEAKKAAEETQEKTIKNVQSINSIVENDDIKSEKTEEKESESSDSGPSTTAVMVVEEGGENKMLNKLNMIEENISKKTKKKIKKILYKYLENDKEYKFIDMQDGLYKMYFLSKNGELIENIIDPFGTINGGEHPRIYKKAINPNGDTPIGFFDLTLDTNLSKMLVNSEDPFIDFNTGMSIPDNDAYNMTIDFSNTPQIDKFNKGVLLNNLNFAINAMANFGINIPKFRFFDLSDENHFTLISDFKVKTPLQYETIKVNGIYCPLGFNKYIDNGRIMTFNNGTVNTYYVNNPDNKLLLAQPFQQQPQQPIQQQQPQAQPQQPIQQQQPQAQPQQPIQQQPQVQEINQTQLFNNIMNNGLGGGFNPFNAYPQQPITPNIITT